MSAHPNGGFVAIFGAAGGIGSAAAREFADRGYALLLADREIERLDELADELRVTSGVRVLTCGFDATDRAAVHSALQDGRTNFGRLHAAVDLLGIAPVTHFLNLEDDEWKRCLDVNLTSTFIIGQEAARIMAQQGGGSIVLTASTSARIAHEGQSAYSATKAGVESLVRTMAVDLGSHNIRVNAVAPGTIMTPMNYSAVSEEARQARLARIPLGRFGDPAEVAKVVAFLASDEASFISGESIRVDAGFLITGVMNPAAHA